MFFSYFFSSLVFGPQGLKADLGVQRNKSQTWRADASLDEKAEKVLEVLNFVQHTFHRHCAKIGRSMSRNGRLPASWKSRMWWMQKKTSKALKKPELNSGWLKKTKPQNPIYVEISFGVFSAKTTPWLIFWECHCFAFRVLSSPQLFGIDFQGFVLGCTQEHSIGFWENKASKPKICWNFFWNFLCKDHSMTFFLGMSSFCIQGTQ